jgi:hypothetical protein
MRDSFVNILKNSSADRHGFCAAKDLFGEEAGTGHIGRAKFEPDPDADVGITNRYVNLGPLLVGLFAPCLCTAAAALLR